MPRLETLGSVVHVVSVKANTFKPYKDSLGKTRFKCVDVSGNAIDIPISKFIWLDDSGECQRLCYSKPTPVSGINTKFKVKPHERYPELSVVTGKNVKLVINRRHHRYHEDEK